MIADNGHFDPTISLPLEGCGALCASTTLCPDLGNEIEMGNPNFAAIAASGFNLMVIRSVEGAEWVATVTTGS